MPPLEIVGTDRPRGAPQAALFDFDGTLSLLRRNWQDVMIPMMVQVLREAGATDPPTALRATVEGFVTRLTGRQTIYQMMRLAKEVQARGGRPRDPLEYKRQYHDLLWQDVRQRIEAVRSGRVPVEEMTVPGSRSWLSRLKDAGLTLYLASGTDLSYVRDELAVLHLEEYFGEHVYGALDDYRRFSKALIIEQLLEHEKLRGDQLVGFGDGFVEIEEVKKVGGSAVGVASDEDRRRGYDPVKRARLLAAGADVIVGDYRRSAPLLQWMGLS